MKLNTKIKMLLFFSMIVFINKANSQSFIDNNKIGILSLSIDYSFMNGSLEYKVPSYYFESNIYAAGQARYDRGFNIVRGVYQKLFNLKLINKENSEKLDKFRRAVNPFVDSIKNMDLSQSNLVKYCLDVFNGVFADGTIISEVELLKSCQRELMRIKNEDPNNYIYTKRYKAISKTLNELENCSATDIKNLSWEKIELSM